MHYKLEDEIDSALEHARVKIAEAERLRDESALEYRKVANSWSSGRTCPGPTPLECSGSPRNGSPS